MRKMLKIGVLPLVLVFGALQLYRPTFSNPPLVPGQPIEEVLDVPDEVQMVFARSCNDCHSNKTVYPWYSKISPFSWFLAGHIEDGRREMNFSEWGTYSTDKQARKMEETCEMVKAGAMPLPSYLWVHREAVLQESQKQMICDWAEGERKKLSVE